MISFDNFLDFNDFDEFTLISQTKSTRLLTSEKKTSPSRQYYFKIFEFKCFSPRDQKIILDTFLHVNLKESQYLQSYNHISFSFESKLRPTFSMVYISSKTVEQVLRTPALMTKLSIENIMQCLFAVAKGMSFLHSHLICHGNLCPSNIVIDEANQFYLCDFGLYPIKKLFMKDEELFNNDYKDPSMRNNEPTFLNDVYSFGVLMCDIYLSYLQATNKLKQNETLNSFLKNNNRNKFDSFPPICVDIIPSCLSSFESERPSFTQIVEKFQNTNQKIFGVSISKLFDDFINSNYLLNLALIDDKYALNKIGEMYEKGEKFEKSNQKALEFFEKAANLNDSEGQKNFGVLLQKTAGKNKNVLEKGAHYLQLSAEQGNIQGMANYGLALLNGIGVEKNFQKAEEYLKKAANLGDSFAEVNYGNLLLDNSPKISEITDGLNYIKKAMNQNNPNAFYAFGILLQKGKFVEKNDKLAMNNFKIAADMGLEEAMIEYANNNLKLVPKNEQVALKYYQLAYENGCEKVIDKINKLKEKIEPTIQKPIKNASIEPRKRSIKQLSDLFLSNDNYSSPRNAVKKMEKVAQEKIEKKEHPRKKREKESSSDDEYKYYLNSVKPKNKARHKTSNQQQIINQVSNNIPVQISSKVKLISIGEVVYNREKYHSTSYIYPVGYQIEKEYTSIENPSKNTIYRSSILDGGESPLFRVECLDKTKMVFNGNTPSTPWRDVRSAIEESRKKFGLETTEHISISGPIAYALSMPAITNLIERLPNAKLCSKYVFKKYFPDKEKGNVNKKNEYSDSETDENNVIEEEEEEDEEEETNQRQKQKYKQSEKSKSDESDESDGFLKSLQEINELPVEKLVQLGDELFDKNDLPNALEFYKEAVKKGNKNILIKCAESSESFDEQLQYLELAIMEQIPGSFSKWRLFIMRHVKLLKDKDNETLLSFAQRFEEYGDFSDAAVTYSKAKDVINSQICFYKAKQKLDDIKDGYQQYSFAIYALNHKDFELAKSMAQKALDNKVQQAESLMEKLMQQKQSKTVNEVDSILEEGINFFEGKNGFEKNFTKAMELFEKASKIGCPKADYYIGFSILNEYGVDHLKKSAEEKDPDGLTLYAHYLKNGKLVAKDVQKAMTYYKLAADKGNPEAAFEYGHDRIENGFVDEGIEYLKKSAEKLFPDALYLYSKMSKKLSDEDSKKFIDFALKQGSNLAKRDKTD